MIFLGKRENYENKFFYEIERHAKKAFYGTNASNRLLLKAFRFRIRKTR